jgi:methylphosphotriester-DNA--protein-cysteine methyltransferase
MTIKEIKRLRETEDRVEFKEAKRDFNFAGGSHADPRDRRKIKSLTGYTPNELLRIIRLQQAPLLLQTSGLNISEIAYETGFTSPAYFTKCFKHFYKESPTDYQKRKS